MEYNLTMVSPFNLITIDVEDWYHGIGLPVIDWKNYSHRIEIGMNKILRILDKRNIKATFFVLGEVAKNSPKIIRNLHQEGHEIASHSLLHKNLEKMNKDMFIKEEKICKDIIENCISDNIIGFRAPFFSVTRKSSWVLKSLQELGYQYDASISPNRTCRHDYVDIAPGIYRISNDLIEITASNMQILKFTIGLGGAHFRLYPYQLSKRVLDKNILRDRPSVFYLHPWELDPNHPKVKIEFPGNLTHYFGLKTTEQKFERIVSEYNFVTCKDLFAIVRNDKSLKFLDLNE